MHTDPYMPYSIVRLVLTCDTFCILTLQITNVLLPQSPPMFQD
ncbi:hypothetical protein M3J09_002337 [Ascochyta lentis]